MIHTHIHICTPTTTIRNQYTPIRMARMWRTLAPNAGKNVEQQAGKNVGMIVSFIAFGDAKCYSHFGRQFSSFLQN